MNAANLPVLSPTARPTYDGLKNILVMMWTCIEETQWRAALVAERDEPMSKESRQTLENIGYIVDKDRLYSEMQRHLAEAAGKEDQEIAALRRTLAQQSEWMQQLRDELRVATSKGANP